MLSSTYIYVYLVGKSLISVKERVEGKNSALWYQPKKGKMSRVERQEGRLKMELLSASVLFSLHLFHSILL